MYKIFLTFLFVSAFQLCHAQSNWQHSYELIEGEGNDDGARGVIADSTGVYIVNHTVCDGNQTICMGIIKLSPENGEVIFKKKYTFPPPVTVMGLLNERCFIKTKDGNYLVAGVVYVDYIKTAFLMKFDQEGDSLWMKTYEAEGKGYPETIVENANGDIFLHSLAYDVTGDLSIVDIAKLDSEGNVIWSQQHDFLDVMTNPVTGGIALLDSGEIMFYFSGNADFYRKIYMAKFDALGNLLWVEHMYEEDSTHPGEVIEKLPDGNFITAFMVDTFSFGPIDITAIPLIVKFDEEGNVLWEFRPPVIGRIAMQALAVTKEGDILVTGHFWNPDYFNENLQGWIAKITTEGELLWQRGYYIEQDPPPFYVIWDVTECPDGSLVAAGTTEDAATSNYDVWVIKLDSEGCFDPNNCDTYNNVVVGTYEIPEEETFQLNIFPNPVTDKQFQIETTHHLTNTEVRIYNPLGQLLSTEKWESKQQVFTLPYNGLFYVSIFSEGKIIKTKTVVAVE